MPLPVTPRRRLQPPSAPSSPIAVRTEESATPLPNRGRARARARGRRVRSARALAPQPPRPPQPPQPPRPPLPPRPAIGPPTGSTSVGAALKSWFTEGNVPVKIGVLVLLFGVAAALRYAAAEGY
jgi:uncharacterized membrane protein